MLVYMIGRNIPLYGIDLKAYEDVSVDAQSILLQALSGDMKNCSLFILGLWPYMIASILAALMRPPIPYFVVRSHIYTTISIPAISCINTITLVINNI